MKRKIIIFLSFLFIVCCFCGLTACINSGSNNNDSQKDEEDLTIKVGSYSFCPTEDGEGYILFKVDDYDKITNAEIPKICNGKNVVQIGNGVFDRAYYLKSVSIPETVTSIGDGAFSNCQTLRSCILPTSLESIGDSAFSECDYLYDMIIPDSVISIGDGAFYSCSSLVRITIGKNINSIGKDAFYCANLFEIYNRSNFSFEKSGEHNLNYYGLDFARINIYSDNIGSSKINVIDDCVFYNNDVDYLVRYIGKEKTINLPETDFKYVINQSAFDRFIFVDFDTEQNIEIITSNSVTTICSSAFTNPAIKKIKLSASVDRIKSNAFYRTSGGAIEIEMADTNNWYRVYTEEEWNKKTGGVAVKTEDEWSLKAFMSVLTSFNSGYFYKKV